MDGGHIGWKRKAIGMEHEQYDIAVIGSGPAGAIFARMVGRRYSVVVIDKKDDTSGGFQKPCGGLLSPDAQKALSRFELTLPKDVLVDPQIFTVRTIDVATGLVRHYQRFYMNLDRRRFDGWLMSLIPEGVRRWEGRCTGIERRDGFYRIECGGAGGTVRFDARYVVGADGAHSLVRRTFFPGRKLRRYVAIQQWFEAPRQNPFYSCVFDPGTSDCCSWSISKDRYLVFGGAFAPRGCRRNFELQKEKLKKFGFIWGRPLRTEACLVLRPRYPWDFCCGGGGVFLLGEAAGFISPSSLEGISWAINSAHILGGIFNAGEDRLQARYRRKTRPLRGKLMLKVLKSPFMYQPLLRKWVMKSGLNTIRIHSRSDVGRGSAGEEG